MPQTLQRRVEAVRTWGTLRKEGTAVTFTAHTLPTQATPTLPCVRAVGAAAVRLIRHFQDWARAHQPARSCPRICRPNVEAVGLIRCFPALILSELMGAVTDRMVGFPEQAILETKKNPVVAACVVAAGQGTISEERSDLMAEAMEITMLELAVDLDMAVDLELVGIMVVLVK